MKRIIAILTTVVLISLISILPVSAEYSAPVEGTVKPTVFDVTVKGISGDFGTGTKLTILPADFPSITNNGDIQIQVTGMHVKPADGFYAPMYPSDVQAGTKQGSALPVYLQIGETSIMWENMISYTGTLPSKSIFGADGNGVYATLTKGQSRKIIEDPSVTSMNMFIAPNVTTNAAGENIVFANVIFDITAV